MDGPLDSLMPTSAWCLGAEIWGLMKGSSRVLGKHRSRLAVFPAEAALLDPCHVSTWGRAPKYVDRGVKNCACPRTLNI